MQDLILHPDCVAGPIHRVSAALHVDTDTGGAPRFHARFRFDGDIRRIKLPAFGEGGRQDYLWKTSCFEVFIQSQGGTFYREFNVSPAGNWAIYDFDDFRANSRDGPDAGIAIDPRIGADGQSLTIEARFETAIALPAAAALNAIV